jgi:hypothetical protein
MGVANHYLSKPLRTLREACRDITAAHPELSSRDCDGCGHRQLCAIYEQIDRGNRSNQVNGHSQGSVE